MTVQEAIQTLKDTPIEDRIQLIEILLRSLKEDLGKTQPDNNVREPFKIHTFDLGADVDFERDELYLERGV